MGALAARLQLPADQRQALGRADQPERPGRAGRPVPVRLGPTHPGAHLQRHEYLLDGALFFDPIAAGTHKLTLQARDFPPMEVSATVTDGAETKVLPILGTAFPLLDPAELLRAVWLPDDSPGDVTRPVAFVVAPELTAAQIIDALRPVEDPELQRGRWWHHPIGWTKVLRELAGVPASYLVDLPR